MCYRALHSALGKPHAISKLLMAKGDGSTFSGAEDRQVHQIGGCASIMANEVTHERVQHVRVDPDFTLHAIAMAAPLRWSNRVRYEDVRRSS